MDVQAIVERCAALPTATLYEAAGKRGDLSPDIRPVVPGSRLSGIAFTVRVLPGDSLGVLRAIEHAHAGSIVVVDAGGTDRAAVWGGTSSLACLARSIGGCVTNGCVRDVDDLVACGLPVFAAGISPRGTQKCHPGWLGLPVSVGGVPISAGDLVFGDADGVVVVAAASALEVAERAEEQRRREDARDDRVRRGEPLGTILDLDLSHGT